MEIVTKKIEEVKPYGNNPRKNKEAVEIVAESIKEFGFKVPIVIDGDGEIVAGHTRLLAAKSLGMEQVPCIVADDLNEDQIKAFRLVDNRTAEFAKWDIDLLAVELKDIDMNLDAFEFIDVDIDFMEFEEDGDGGGSQMATTDKTRVVIGALMFDIKDGTHEIYKKTQAADVKEVEEQVLRLIEEGLLL